MEADTLLKAIQADRAAVAKTDNDPLSLTLTKRKAYFDGNQAGKNLEFWNGLKPTDATEFDEFKRRIVIVNITRPVCRNVTNHILGRDPEWTASTGENVLKPDDERVKAYGAWHKGVGKVHKTLKEADQIKNWAGKSYILMYVPDIYRQWNGGKLEQGGRDIAQAVRLIRVDALTPLEAGAIREDGVIVAYWRSYSVLNAEGKTENRVEVYEREFITVYVEQNGNLEKATVGDGVENPRANPLFNPDEPLEFRALMFELERDDGSMVDALIDPQNSVNVTRSNMRRNGDLAGYPETYTIDAARPKDNTGQVVSWTRGPSRMMDIQTDYLYGQNGQAIVDGNGNPIMAPQAQIGKFDPVDSRGLRDDAEAYKADALWLVNQLWTLHGEGQISGESKRQSRRAFDLSLTAESEPAAAALAWMIETLDRFAQWIGGAKQAADPITVTPRLFLDVDKTDLPTLQHLTAMQAAGQLSLEALLEASPGVENVELELERIRNERALNPTALNALRELGWDAADWLTALQKLGYPISSEAIGQARDMSASAAQGLGQAQGGEDDAPDRPAQ